MDRCARTALNKSPSRSADRTLPKASGELNCASASHLGRSLYRFVNVRFLSGISAVIVDRQKPIRKTVDNFQHAAPDLQDAANFPAARLAVIARPVGSVYSATRGQRRQMRAAEFAQCKWRKLSGLSHWSLNSHTHSRAAEAFHCACDADSNYGVRVLIVTVLIYFEVPT